MKLLGPLCVLHLRVALAIMGSENCENIIYKEKCQNL